MGGSHKEDRRTHSTLDSPNYEPLTGSFNMLPSQACKKKYSYLTQSINPKTVKWLGTYGISWGLGTMFPGREGGMQRDNI